MHVYIQDKRCSFRETWGNNYLGAHDIYKNPSGIKSTQAIKNPPSMPYTDGCQVSTWAGSEAALTILKYEKTEPCLLTFQKKLEATQLENYYKIKW